MAIPKRNLEIIEELRSKNDPLLSEAADLIEGLGQKVEDYRWKSFVQFGETVNLRNEVNALETTVEQLYEKIKVIENLYEKIEDVFDEDKRDGKDE